MQKIKMLAAQKKIMSAALQYAKEALEKEIEDLMVARYRELETVLKPFDYLLCVHAHYDEPRVLIFKSESNLLEETKIDNKIEIIDDVIIFISPSADPHVHVLVADFLQKLKDFYEPEEF